jgi:lycopene cyclase CruP
MSLTEQMLAGLPGHPLAGLQRPTTCGGATALGNLTQQQVIYQADTPLASVEWDVVICGGTLGCWWGPGWPSGAGELLC